MNILSKEDLASMSATHSEVVLVYAIDGTPYATVGTSDQIESILEENAKELYEDSAYDSFDGIHYPITLDEAKDKVWACASICTQDDYIAEQALLEDEQE